MRVAGYAVTFLGGALAGALALFLYLQSSDRIVTEANRSRQDGAGPPRSQTLDAEPTGTGRLPSAATPEEVPPSRPSSVEVVPPSEMDVEPPSEIRAPEPSDRPVPSVPEAVRRRGLLIPVRGIAASALRDDFHDRRDGSRGHGALDIPAPRGTPVVATDDGTIRKLFFSRAGGITIYQFNPEETLVYYYAHLQGYAPGVTEGKVVKKGEVIGYVGISGNAPPGTPHLHFAISRLPPTKEWWKGEPMNPYTILTGR